MALEDFSGTWKLEKSENFTELLKAMDIGMAKRKIAESLTPTHKIEVADGKIKITTITTLKTKSEELQIGQENDVDVQGVQTKALATFEDGTLKMKVTQATKQKVPDISRYIEDGKMILKLECGGVVCKRIFKKE